MAGFMIEQPVTKPGNFVGNGPFKLKNALERRAYRGKKSRLLGRGHRATAGHPFLPHGKCRNAVRRRVELHNTYEMIPAKIEQYDRLHGNPSKGPYLGSYFYRYNFH